MSGVFLLPDRWFSGGHRMELISMCPIYNFSAFETKYVLIWTYDTCAISLPLPRS